MKKILSAFFCLLIACTQEENINQTDICSVASTLPSYRFEIYPQNINTQYQYFIDNYLVWNDCTSDSDFSIYSLGIYPNDSGSPAFVKIIKGNLHPLALRKVRLRIHELDSVCQPLPALVDATLETNEEIISSGSGTCSYPYSNFSLSIGL